MATIGNFSAVRDGGFAGAGTSRLQSPAQRPSISPGAGNISAGRVFGGDGANSRSPLSAYGREFNFTQQELENAAISGAPALFGSRLNPSLLMLKEIQNKTNASPELQGIAAAIRAPFTDAYQQKSVPSGLLDSAVKTASGPSSGFPEFDRLTSVPSYAANANSVMGLTVGSPYNNITNDFAPASSPVNGPAGMTFNAEGIGIPSVSQSGMSFNGGLLGTSLAAPQQQDMGPLSDAAISAALSYQNSPLENDIAFLASRIGPSASPEALALVEPKFVTELAKEIRTAEEATGTTARINDMYRSPETQGKLYAELKAQDPNYMVAPAGKSLHQGAFSADISRGPVLDYMRANTPASLNFPYGPRDLVHVQLSDPEIAALGYNVTSGRVDKSPFGAFTSTIGDDGGVMFAGGDMGQLTPSSIAASPSPAPAFVQTAAPQEQARVAATPSLPPRTPTPSLLGRFATALTGIPGYDTGPGLLGGGFKTAEIGTQLLAGSQPQVVEAASAPEAPPAVRPAAEPVSLASLLIDRAISRGEDRKRRKRMSTTVEQMQRDTIGGLLA